jgi:hypothetical protein
MARLDKWEDFGIDPARATTAEERAAERLNARGTQSFVDNHPEFYKCEENADLVVAWLYIHNDAPATRLNLELAQRALADDLKKRPPAEQVEVDRWAGVTISRSDALLEYQPSDDERETLAKVADDSSLNDHQRKARDRKLRLLAGTQRRQFSDLKPGADPRVVI